jgi:hypothetical protein
VPGLDTIVSGLANGYIVAQRVKNIAPVTLAPGMIVSVSNDFITANIITTLQLLSY